MTTTAKAPDNVAVWFEIPAANFDRAVGFYEQVFQTKLAREKFGPADLAVFPYEQPGTSGCGSYLPYRRSSITPTAVSTRSEMRCPTSTLKLRRLPSRVSSR